MDAKSVIACPFAEQPLNGPGVYEISGPRLERRRPVRAGRCLRRWRQDLGGALHEPVLPRR